MSKHYEPPNAVNLSRAVRAVTRICRLGLKGSSQDETGAGLPAYPFDAKIDQDFVEELVDDFGGVDVLNEIKNFRWFNDSKPVSHLRSVRLALRRWIANSKKRKAG